MKTYIIVFLFWNYFSQVLTQRCPVGWLERTEGMSCYRFWPTRLKSWEDARATCQARGGDLLKLDSFSEKDWIIRELKKYPVGYEWWIGLRRHPENDTIWLWSDGSQRSEVFLQWGSGEPNNYLNSENCAEIWDNLLNDKNCNHLLQFVCERPKDLPIACDVDDGWDNVTPDRCFKLFPQPVTYSQANDLCKKEDAEVLSIQDEYTQQNISDFLDSAVKISVWLPYTANTSTSEFKYGQETVTMSWWKSGLQADSKNEGNDTLCSVLDTNITKTYHNWRQVSCDDVNSVLCSKPKGTCPSGFVQHSSTCYLLNTGDFMTWNEARGFCNLQNTSLLEIKDEDSWSFLSSFLKLQYQSTKIKNIWLGLTVSDTDKEKWVWLSDMKDAGDFETKMIPPLSPVTSKRCIYTDISTNKWVFGDCAEVGGAVCTVPVDQVVITPPPVGKVWNADFANELWIGLNDLEKENTFQWLDTGVETMYTNWLYPPNNAEIGQRYSENCVAMYLNKNDPNHGKWLDYSCNVERNFICKRPADLNIARGKNMIAKKDQSSCSPEELFSSCCFVSLIPDFWTIWDLGSTYYIKSIISTSVPLNVDAVGVHIFVSNTDTFDDSKPKKVSVLTDELTTVAGTQEPLEGRYVKIQHRPSPLIACAVYIIADASIPLSIKYNGVTKDQIPCVSTSSKWRGNVSYTQSGRLCQAWAKDYPHRHIMHDKFEDETQEDAGNFCRDPLGLGHVWCYTVDPDTRWEYCGVESCDDNDNSSQSSESSCKECLKPSRNMLTWSDAKQVCAIDGKVLPLHINEELLDTESLQISQKNGQYWLSIYYDAGKKYWLSITNGVPVPNFLLDLIDVKKPPNSMCAVGNSKGQIFAKSCFDRYSYLCAPEDYAFMLKTSSDESFKEIPANFIGKTVDKNNFIRFEFKGFDGATIKLNDYTIRIGGNLFATSYISMGEKQSVKHSTLIEHLCSDTEYKPFWIVWTMDTSCKISVGTGYDIEQNVFLQYNDCPDRNIKRTSVLVATVMKTSKTYAGFWKFKELENLVATFSEDINIALNKPARQSSSFSGFSTADKAVDGCKNPTYSSRCITHTQRNTNPWWEVDLERAYTIKYVVIRRRWEHCCRDRLGYFQLYISMFRDSSRPDDMVYKSTEHEPPEIIRVSGNGKRGRYVRLMVPRETFIELSEVEVFEDTDASRCGKDWIDYEADNLGTCFKFSSVQMNWETAKEYCNSLNAKMVIPRSAEEQLFLYEHSPVLSNIWIGIHDINREGTIEAVDNSKLLYTDWGEGEPNNFGGNEDCAILRLDVSHKSGKWNDASCSNNYFAVCKRQELSTTTSTTTTTTTTTTTPVPTTTQSTTNAPTKQVVFEQGVCRTGWTFNDVSNTCIKIVSASNIDVFEAASKCLQDGSQLASLANSSEQAFVISLTKHLGMQGLQGWDGLWIGGMDAHAEAQWEWFMRDTPWDGSLVWVPGQPDNTNEEDCVMIVIHESRFGELNDLPCLYKGITAGYVCQYDPGSDKCDAGWVYNPKMDSCYKHDATPTSWKLAVKKCELANGKLVSIKNRIEQFFLQALSTVNNGDGDPVWVGAFETETYQWRWINTLIKWTGDGMFDVKDASSSELITYEPRCGALTFVGNLAGFMFPIPCIGSPGYTFICERRDVSVKQSSTIRTTSTSPSTPKFVSQVDRWACGAGWYVDTLTGFCYKFAVGLKYATTWSDAQQKCAEEDGSLTSIVSNNEQAYIIGRLQGMFDDFASTTGIWIGATDSAVEHQWHWENGDPFAFLNWAPGTPDFSNTEDHCAEIHTNSSETFGLWNDAQCNLLKGYICKKARYTEGTTTETPKYFVESNETIEFYQASEGVNKNFKKHDLFELGVRVKDTFVFQVKTKHDAHVLLQNKRDVYESSAYLVIIGGWGNKRSIIEEINAGSADRVENYDIDLLSMSSFRSFWITWNSTTILVGASDKIGSLVLLTYTNNKIYDINFVSVSTAQYTDAYWKIPKGDKYYGCEGTGWMKYAGSCFQIVEKQMTWQDANSFCHKEGGLLASIDNQNQQDFILSQLPRDRYCFNIHDNDTECKLWAETGECHKNPVWMTTHCHRACDVCMVNCRDIYESSEKCLHWANMGECKVNYPWMLSNCALSCGVCAGAPTRGYWIGLKSFGYEQSYTWADDTRVKYTNWGARQPDAFRANKGSCVGMYVQNGKWNDGGCNDLTSGFICKKPLSTLDFDTTDDPFKVGCSTDNSYGYGAYCYIYQTDEKSWRSAQTTCETLGGSLAYIDNLYTQSFLSSELTKYNSDFWIGLNVTNSKYSWAGQSVQSVKVSYFNQDYTDKNTDGCFAMSSKRPVGLWDMYDDCTTKLPFICQIPRDGFTTSTTTATISTESLPDCQDNWTSNNSSYCYYMLNFPMQWQDANVFCNVIGSSMVSIVDDTENAFVTNLCLTSDDGACWIGLNDINNEGEFQWEDGTFYQYNKWGRGEPNNEHDEDCVEIRSYLSIWNDVPCSVYKMPICKVPRGKNVSRVITPSPNIGTDKSVFTFPTLPSRFTPLSTTLSVQKPMKCESYGGFCYAIDNIPGPFFLGDTSCGYIHREMKLASIRSEEENNNVVSFFGHSSTVGDMGGDFVWLGLYIPDGNIQNLNYTNFESDQITRGCVAMNVKTGKWTLLDCFTAVLPYLCKAVADDEGSTITTVVTIVTNDKETTNKLDVTTESGIRVPPFHQLFDTEAVNDVTSGLSGGQIAAVVIGIIGTLIIIGVIAYVIKSRQVKHTLFPMEEPSLGFDNALFSKDQDTVSIK